MRITTKGRYALRAMILLAKSYSGSPISIKELSRLENISPEFLEQIFFKLRKAGIIASTRGPGGGFSLMRDPKSISLNEVFEAVGEGVELTPCSGDDVCERADECDVHDVWVAATAHFRKYFSRISIQDILNGKIKV